MINNKYIDPRFEEIPLCDDEVVVLSTLGKGPKGDKGEKGDPITDVALYNAVAKYIENHPGYVTTLMDGAVIERKLDPTLSLELCRCFDTVEQMQNATDLKVGMICHTNGFHSAGDGGAAFYQATADGEPNGMDVLTMQNDLIANLVITKSYVTPEQFGAIETGVCNGAKFVYVLNYAARQKLEVRFVSDFEFEFVPDSTVSSPTRNKIEAINGLTIDGCGHAVTMSGLTKAYLESIDDDSSSGRDIFSLLSFYDCSDIFVHNLRIYGENASDAVNSFRYQSPRSIGIAFKHCDNCVVENVSGTDILGNVVNATTDDTLSDGCSNIRVLNCTAENCYENGFNFMGKTIDSIIDSCISTNCGNGLEIYGSGCVASNCVSIESYTYGIALSGGAYVQNCTVIGSKGTSASTGIGISVTESDNNTVDSCLVKDCVGFGLNVFPAAKNTTVRNCKFINNSIDHSFGVTFNCQGTSTDKMQNLVLQDNYIYSDGSIYLANFANNYGLKIVGNIINHPNRNNYIIALASTTDGSRICNNYLSGIVNVGSSTDYFVAQNVVNNTIPVAQTS